MPFTRYSVCPCCGSEKIQPRLLAIDYTVSKKQFAIWECRNCTLRFTQDIPDADSIAAYYKSEEYISHTDTKKGFVNSLYHVIRKKTLNNKRRLIEKHAFHSKGSLLDIGAGTGAFAFHMKQSGWDVKALEPDPLTRRKANELYKLTIDPAELLFHFKENSFDVVTMWHVLEHVHDLHTYLKQIRNILKVNGKSFIAVPNYTSFDARHYEEFWAAYDVPRHLYHFSPLSFQTLLDKNGLKLHSYEPMWFDSFYISMLSEKYKHGFINYLNAVFNGVRSNLEAIKDNKKSSSLVYIIGK